MRYTARIFYRRFVRLFRSPVPVPHELDRLFLHLYMDIAWFGILSGTTIAFIAVYATRVGASAEQIGLLTAVPGLVNLVFALPAGAWLSRRSIGRAVFWSSILQRAFYLLLIPMPILLVKNAQVWTIIGLTLVMTIPGTAMVVGFNSLFGEGVPVEWRGHVVGIRNALLSVVTTVFTLISGQILNRVAFPYGYMIVFALGVFGAGMSSLHLYFLSAIVGRHPAVEAENGLGAEPGPEGEAPRPYLNGRRQILELRSLYNRGIQSLRLDVMRGPFLRLMGLLFLWHLAQFMAIPTFTPFVVNQLRLSDQTISLAGALFNATMFLGSLRLSTVTGRFGNKRITAAGIMALGLFPILTATGGTGYLIGNAIGGVAWAMAGGALYNYILEYCPDTDRPAHLAWYNLVFNAAILVGSLAGPTLAGTIGFVTALVIFGIARSLSGVAIMKWG